MVNPPIKIVRSAATDITLTITDADGEIVDLTGAVVYFNVKLKADTLLAYDTDSLAKIRVEQATHITPLEGITKIELDNADTNIPVGAYVYGIKVVPAIGKPVPSDTAPFIIRPRGVADGN